MHPSNQVIPPTNRDRVPVRLLIPGLLTCFLLSAGSSLLAQCEAPHYRVAKVDQETPSSIDEDVSIKLSDFTPRKLVCLASAIKDRYRGRNKIFIAIFSDHEAAKYFLPLGPEATKQLDRWASKLHAVYDFDAAEHRDRLVLIPDNLAGGEVQANFDTTIDLPVSVVPKCRVEVRDRCLVDHSFSYIWGKGLGEVTLIATITTVLINLVPPRGFKRRGVRARC